MRPVWVYLLAPVVGLAVLGWKLGRRGQCYPGDDAFWPDEYVGLPPAGSDLTANAQFSPPVR